MSASAVRKFVGYSRLFVILASHPQSVNSPVEQFLVSVCVMAAEVTASMNAVSRFAGICLQVRFRALGGAAGESAPSPCFISSSEADLHKIAR